MERKSKSKSNLVDIYCALEKLLGVGTHTELRSGERVVNKAAC